MRDGTSGATAPTSATFDTAFMVSNPTHAHGTFAGWNISGMDTATSHFYGPTNPPTGYTNETTLTTSVPWFKNLRATSGTVTFTATWTCDAGYSGNNCTATTNTLTLSKNGGTGTIKNNAGTTYTSTTNGSMTCTTGSSVSLPTWASGASSNNTTNITKGTGTASKIFLGWSTSNSATTGSFSITCPTGNTTYYAVWGTPTCDIANGTGTVATSSNNSPVCNVSCTNGYSKTGYLDTTTSGFTTTGDANQTTASYTCKARTYKVTLDPKRYASSSATTGTDPDTTGTTQYWYRYKTHSPCYYYSVGCNLFKCPN